MSSSKKKTKTSSFNTQFFCFTIAVFVLIQNLLTLKVNYYLLFLFDMTVSVLLFEFWLHISVAVMRTDQETERLWKILNGGD